MADLEKLKERIDASGVKRVHIANKLGVTPLSLRRKLSGVQPLTLDNVRVFTEVLHLTGDEVHDIFFA